MPRGRRHTYYDPFIQEPTPEQLPEPVELRGVAVEHPGTYILFGDFLEAIRQYAEQSEVKDQILELVIWLESGAT